MTGRTEQPWSVIYVAEVWEDYAAMGDDTWVRVIGPDGEVLDNAKYGF